MALMADKCDVSNHSQAAIDMKKERQTTRHTNTLSTSEMSASAVAEERAREAAYESGLAALRADSGDSCSSDSEALLRSALRPLQQLESAPRAQPKPAAALLPPLATALRATYPHDVRFLDEYYLLLNGRTQAEVQIVTEELMQSVEDALSAGNTVGGGEGGGGVVLACWLGGATGWRDPRVPRALPALLATLQQLGPQQVTEVARALHAALDTRELLALSDAVRCDGSGAGHELAALLLRAALARLLAHGPHWEAGAPTAAEVRTMLVTRWDALDSAAQLSGLELAARVLAHGAPDEARVLLADLKPPPPKDGHDPDYLKVSVAVKTLQNLFKDK